MPRFPSRRRLLQILFALASLLLLREFANPPDGWLAGRGGTFVHLLFGFPTATSSGHYGLPDARWAAQFKGRVKTETFSRLFCGTIYVSYEERDGAWIAIANSYLPRGRVF